MIPKAKQRVAAPMKFSITGRIITEASARTAASEVNSPKIVSGCIFTITAAITARNNALPDPHARIFGIRSYFRAPRFCPTILAAAVVMEFERIPIIIFSFPIIPAIALAIKPKELTQAATTVCEMEIAADCKAIGTPRATIFSIAFPSGIKLFGAKSKSKPSLCL